MNLTPIFFLFITILSKKKVCKGKLYTNNGFWDTYKTVYPLLSLIAPEVYEDILDGIVTSYKDTGFLPKWLSPDERGMMPGTLVDAVIADAAVKGIGKKQLPELFQGMIDTATSNSKNSRYGRIANQKYQALGYIPNNYQESVNQTQDYAYSDFCIARVAEIIGKKDIAKLYYKKSLNYRKLIDKTTSFLRSKNENGLFRKQFNASCWGEDYTEGSSFQNSFAMYHDFLGYIKEIGGIKKFSQLLQNLFNQNPIFDVHGYGFEIHEMSELAALDFGQMAISNQPSFHLPYLYHYIGQPHLAQLIIKNLVNQAFTEKGFPGDEDNGSMSSWYIFNCLGFYPITPGSGQYVIGIPAFDKATISLTNGKSLSITCEGNVPQYQFVKQFLLNGNLYNKLYINHKELLLGAKLDVSLSLVPPFKTYSVDDLPYSLTK